VKKKKKSAKKSKTTAKNLEDKFDRGEDILDYFETETKVRRINVDIPDWAIKALDKEANRRGITRQSLIKHWLIDKIDSKAS